MFFSKLNILGKNKEDESSSRTKEDEYSSRNKDDESSSGSIQIVRVQPSNSVNFEKKKSSQKLVRKNSSSLVRRVQFPTGKARVSSAKLADMRAEIRSLERMMIKTKHNREFNEVKQKYEQQKEFTERIKRREGETVVPTSSNKKTGDVDDDDVFAVAKMFVTNIWKLIHRSRLAKIQCLLLFLCLFSMMLFSAYQFTQAYASETAVFKPKKITKQVTYFEGDPNVPQYEVPNVYLLFLMHVSDWSKTPNSTSQVEDFILSHVSLKEDEAEVEYAASIAEVTDPPTVATTPSPTRQTVSNFSFFNEITEVGFSLSQTSFYPYCEAGTGKKIGVWHIDATTYSTLQDTTNPTMSPSPVPSDANEGYTKRHKTKDSHNWHKSKDLYYAMPEELRPGSVGVDTKPSRSRFTENPRRRDEGSVHRENLTLVLFPISEYQITLSTEAMNVATNITNSSVVIISYAIDTEAAEFSNTTWKIMYSISVSDSDSEVLSAKLLPSSLPTMIRSFENELSVLGVNVSVLDYIGGSCCVGLCGGPGCEGRYESCYCDEYCEGQGDCCADYTTTCLASSSEDGTDSYYWECNDGEFIPYFWVCDWEEDCDDGSDESDCTGGFECADGEIIPESWYCDFEDDCSDGSDEIGCFVSVDCGNGVSEGSCSECAADESESENCGGECLWLDLSNQIGECVDGYICADGTILEGCQYCGEDNCDSDSCSLDDDGVCAEVVCDIASPAYLGDGWCDGDLDNYNTGACGFDSGDCCEDTCVTTEYQCGSNGYYCLDPDSSNYGSAAKVDEDEIIFSIAPFLLLLDMNFVPPSKSARKFLCHTSFTMYVPEDAGYVIETLFLITRNNYTGLSKSDFMDLVDNELWATMPSAGGEAPLVDGFKMQVRYKEKVVDGVSYIVTEIDSSPQNNHIQEIIWEPFHTVTHYESYVSYSFAQWLSSTGANYALATALFFVLLIFIPRRRDEYGILAFMSMEYRNTTQVVDLKHELELKFAKLMEDVRSLPDYRKSRVPTMKNVNL